MDVCGTGQWPQLAAMLSDGREVVLVTEVAVPHASSHLVYAVINYLCAFFFSFVSVSVCVCVS